MSAQPLDLLVRRLRRLADRADAAEVPDADLLARFVRQADETAFAALVRRHGGLVLGVCRRVLGHEADAEDAFQATFLVLARKAGGIARGDSLPAWLHRVAQRTALVARAARARRAAREGPWVETPAPPGEDPVWRDLRPVLDEEIGRLPEKYRLPFVLCHLEGKTNEEAAAVLGCPQGTVLSRLSRAREKLRGRLTRRGVTVPSAGLGALLAAHADASPALIDLTARAALPGAVLPATAAALAQGVLRAMIFSKVKAAALAGLALTALTGGVMFANNVWQATAAAAVVLPGNPPGAAPPAAGAVGAAPAPADPAANPLPEDPRRRLARVRLSANNLKQIGVAIHNHESALQYLPPPAITDKQGKPLLSWRVALLPFLEEDMLYRQFKLDEPWDSAHNLKLLAQMPRVYAAPGREKPETGLTFYQAFVGPGTAFERLPKAGAAGGIPAGGKLGGPGVGGPGGGLGAGLPGGAPGGEAGGGSDGKMRFSDITDGTSHTIFVAEAATPVPWTKPEDLPFPKMPDRLGGVFGGDFHALMGDGSIRFLGARTPRDLLAAAVTRAGGEVIDWTRVAAAGHVDLQKASPQDIEKENVQIKDALQRTLREVEQARAALERAKEEFHLKTEAAARTARLVRENQELTEKLAEANRQLEQLRAEVEKVKSQLKR